MHRPTKHTPRLLQLWLTRFAIMVRIKLHEPLLKEAEPFGNLSKPDTFYQMLSNLQQVKMGDGTSTITSEQDKVESIRLWTGGQMRVLHSIFNCAIALKDYRLASKKLVSLQKQASSQAQKRALSSALCRLWLLVGHVKAAIIHLEDAREQGHHLCPTPDVREYVDLGLIDIAHGKYQEAANIFANAADQESTNIMECALFLVDLQKKQC